jgi:hypothetical protein
MIRRLVWLLMLTSCGQEETILNATVRLDCTTEFNCRGGRVSLAGIPGGPSLGFSWLRCACQDAHHPRPIADKQEVQP